MLKIPLSTLKNPFSKQFFWSTLSGYGKRYDKNDMEVPMKVKFNRAALQDALTTVMAVIPGRTPKPVLQCMRITADKEAVQLSATDLEVAITYTINQVRLAKRVPRSSRPTNFLRSCVKVPTIPSKWKPMKMPLTCAVQTVCLRFIHRIRPNIRRSPALTARRILK